VGGVIGDEGALEGGSGELVVGAIRRYHPDLQSRTGHGTTPPKWEGANLGSARARQWRWRRGEEAGATNLDVVVGAGGGEAAGGGVEVEAEHRLLVVPVDLQRPASHLVKCWTGSALQSLSLSRVWIGFGERENQRREKGVDCARTFHSVARSLLLALPARSGPNFE